MKKLVILCLFFLSAGANATLETCTDLYVGKIRLVAPHGLQRFTLVENPQGTNSSTGGWSQWIMVIEPQWDDDSRKEVLSILMAAKASGQKVSIQTTDSSQCGISASGQTLTLIEVQVNY